MDMKTLVRQSKAGWRDTLILLRHDHTPKMHPTDSGPLNSGDTPAELGGPEQPRKLMQDSR